MLYTYYRSTRNILKTLKSKNNNSISHGLNNFERIIFIVPTI